MSKRITKEDIERIGSEDELADHSIATILSCIRALRPKLQLYDGVLLYADLFDPAEAIAKLRKDFKNDTEYERFAHHLHFPEELYGCEGFDSISESECVEIVNAYVALLESELKRVCGDLPFKISVFHDRIESDESDDTEDGDQTVAADDPMRYHHNHPYEITVYYHLVREE